jgi:hypothetical protein
MHLICGAFDSSIAETWRNLETPTHRRIYSKNPDKYLDRSFLYVGVDDQQVFDGKDYHNRLSFMSNIGKHKEILTLTRREKELIISSGIFKAKRLVCFEEIYPFFAGVKYVSCSHKNYTFLKRALNYVSKLKINGATTNYWSQKYLHKVARKIGSVSTLDLAFFHASNVPYQESFKLSEARQNRCVIALDFNSMYGACMTGDFPDPTKLFYSKINKIYFANEPLNSGLYRVLLSYPKTEFIKKYHALKFAVLNRKYSFSMDEQSQVEVLLHSNEIHFYAKHFAATYIYEGVISARNIPHPLINDVHRTYAQRTNFKKQGNQTLERLCKLQIATIHSAVNRKKFRTIVFHEPLEACLFFQMNYGIKRPEGMHLSVFFGILSDGVRFTIKIDKKITITYISFKDDSVIHSLFSQVIANSRVKMLQAIEFMKEFPGLEICYCNIDSLHISIPTESTQEFHRYVEPLIGGGMGMLKIEAEAEKGYWFEPGRYWLIKGNAISLFKNQGLNTPYTNDLFQDSLSYYKTYEEDGFTIPIKCRRNIAGALTYKNKISNINDPTHIEFCRYDIADILTPNKVQESITNEIKSSSITKLDLFYQLAKKYKC